MKVKRLFSIRFSYNIEYRIELNKDILRVASWNMNHGNTLCLGQVSVMS